MTNEIECQFCHKFFYPKKRKKKDWPKIKFCSRRCHFESRKIYRMCQYCGEKFHVRLYNVANGRDLYCSQICRTRAAKKRVSLWCANCGKLYFRQPHKSSGKNKTFCSRECHHKYIRKDGWSCLNCGITLKEAIKKHEGDKQSYREKRTSNKYKYCNKECAAVHRKSSKTVECYVCKKLIKRKPSQIREFNFCCRQHMYLWRDGKIGSDKIPQKITQEVSEYISLQF